MKKGRTGDGYERVSRLAKSYVPQWHFDPQKPDAGSALAMLLDDMHQDSLDRFGRVMHLHKIQYLNLFDRLKEEPIESAKSYVQIMPVSGMADPVFVKKGTRLFAEDEKSQQRMIFETMHGITTTSARLKTIYSTDKKSDCISCLMCKEDADIVERYRFRAFGLSAQNQAEHLLLLGFDESFDHMDAAEIGICVDTVNPKDREEAVAQLAGGRVQFFFQEPEGTSYLLTKFMVREGVIWLSLEGYLPQKTNFCGKEQYVLCLKAKELFDLEISNLHLLFSGKEMEAEVVTASGITQNSERFFPFGSPMEIYAECGIENKTVLARVGAQVTLSFRLEFQMIEQQMPQPEQATDYRVIMKKPVDAPRMETLEVHADYVLLEYLSMSGWKGLIQEEHAVLLFNGSAQGEVSLCFTCPQDLISEEDAQGECRLRMRLLRADNLYQMPCRQFVPIINHLRFAYSYDQNALVPSRAILRNNFEQIEVTEHFLRNRGVRLFYSREIESPAMYFGFDTNPTGSPMSLYFEVENEEDIPLDCTVECLSKDGFVPIQIVDNTAGLLYSGTMLFLIPADAQRRMLFHENLYWIRMVRRNDGRLLENLPTIRGIYTNMVRVENVNTRSEIFFVDDIHASVRIELAEKNLISADVYINEEDYDKEREENWVKWEKRTFAAQQGRFYQIDLVAGVVEFEKNCFSAFLLKENGAAIRVDYRSYHGAAANVAADTITTMEQSMKYISGVTNPMPAYGGYDGYNEKTSAAIISNMLRTRGRAVTSQDYFDIISQVSYGVRQIKCCSGVNRFGEQEDDSITVALLIEEYEKGNHIFSAVKDTIRNQLLASGAIVPLGKDLVLCQPYFVKLSVRIWIACESMESIYDLQKQTDADICGFIDPLGGGFEGTGWQIGNLPTVKQLLAYLKMKRPGLSVIRVAMNAKVRGQEIAVDDNIIAKIKNPFAMAVNDQHTVYAEFTVQ